MALHTPSRRGFLTGLVSLLAAPAVVRVASIMPVSAPKGGEWIGIDYGSVEVTELHVFGETTTEIYHLYGGGRGGGKSNLLTLNQITREAVRLFQNSNAFLEHIDNQYRLELEFHRSAQWSERPFRRPVTDDIPPTPVGSALRIRLPASYTLVPSDGSGA